MTETTKVYAFSTIHFSDLFNYGSFLSYVGKRGPLLLRKPSVCFVFWVQVFCSPQQPAEKITVHLGES